MILTFQLQQKQAIEANNLISYKEICEILDAFQIVPGQSFAIGKTKALLDHLKNGNSFTIENFNDSNNKIVKTIKDLAFIYKTIDSYIDLGSDKNFKQYFS